MMNLVVLLLALVFAVGFGVAFARFMRHRPRWMGVSAFLIMVVGIIAGVALGFPGSTLGRALFIFGLVSALTAWTVAAPRLTSVIVWSLIAAMLLPSALLVILPFDFRALALWIALAVSLIWVAFQFFCYWDKRGWRVATSLIAVSVLSGYIVFTTPPPV